MSRRRSASQRKTLRVLATNGGLAEHNQLHQFHPEIRSSGAFRNYLARMRERGFITSHTVGGLRYHLLAERRPLASRTALAQRIGALEFFLRRPQFRRLSKEQFLERFPPLAAALNRQHPCNSFFLDDTDPDRQRLGNLVVHCSGSPRHTRDRLARAVPQHGAFERFYRDGRFSLGLVCATEDRARTLRRYVLESACPHFLAPWPDPPVHVEVFPRILEILDRRF